MIRFSSRAILACFLFLKLSVSGAQPRDSTSVYEALFDQSELLGLARTYYVREGEDRPNFFDIPVGFNIPEEYATYLPEEFGRLSVVIVDEDYVSSLWDGGCQAGWAAFHAQYPEAEDLTQVSQVAFSEERDQAAVFVHLGRGCQHSWFATFHLEKQDGEWMVIQQTNVGGA